MGQQIAISKNEIIIVLIQTVRLSLSEKGILGT